MIDYSFSLRTIFPYLVTLPAAILQTLLLAILVIVLSLPIGAVFAVGRQNGPWPVRFLGTVYVEFFRNTPPLVLLYFVFFVIPYAGIRLSSFNAALIALVVNSGSYLTEIFRAGLVALPKGQYEAAYSQGMTRLQTFRHVMLTQILRTIYAPLGNHCIGVVHASSLASIISVMEVTAWAENTGASSFRFFETFGVAALVYVCICQFINLTRLQVGRYLFRRHVSKRPKAPVPVTSGVALQ